MTTLANYAVGSSIYESANSLIYRGRRAGDGLPVVLKLLKDPYPSPEQIARMSREYEIVRRLAAGGELPGVIKALALETDHQRPVIIFEDVGGQSLAQQGIAGKLGLAELLRLAIAVADTIGQLHQRQVIHKDINPSNIIYNQASGAVQIIDFGISTLLSRENPSLRSPNVLEGTLAYLSPEQTGRMNRAIDYRTDLYSLGATLYELLTGERPFGETDPLELVHAHLALQPEPPSRRRPEIPPVVSAIVLRLMAKNAEDRYQSAQGLKADLERCLDQLERGGIESFELGADDRSDRFQISQKLYGRERELATLLDAFERVAAVAGEGDPGRSELLLVAGYPGIGKSALVQELYRPITRRHGYFTAGKFDQLQRNIPYSALIQGLRALVRQLLTESEDQIAGWRETLQAALGVNGQVIVDVIPDVALIIGPQPPLPELAPTEAQNRFNLVFQQLIQAFAGPSHPLVIFLDDLQWADGASLRLLESLVLATASHHLLLIGAYRDNEAGEAHPLMLSLKAIREAGIAPSQISLGPLRQEDVEALLADSLPSGEGPIRELARLSLAKTDGNPFFLTEFLKSLYQEQLLRFDHRAGRWQWDVRDIQRHAITDNVVELMARKISQLPAATQGALHLAAAIGNQFDLRTLALVGGQPPSATAASLWPALQEGLVLPLSESYALAGLGGDELDQDLEYRFAHDRVQQAVYSLLGEASRQSVHLRIGRQLLEHTPPAEREQRIFAIVNQFNLATPLLADEAERDEIAGLNLLAGQKAIAAAAYGPALAYLQAGIGLLGADGWGRRAADALALHVEGAEAAYLSGAFETMEALIDEVLARREQPLDRARVYDIKVRANIAQNNPPEAIRLTLQALELLGVSIPAQPGEAEIGGGLMKTQAAWAGRSIAELAELPRMTDPTKLAAMQILSTVMPVTYVAAPALVPMFALAMVDLSLEYGNAPASTFGYATYGLVLSGVLGDLASGYQFGQMALRLLELLDAKEFKARTYFYVYLFTIHGQRHVRESLAPALEAYQSGLETGDIANSALTAMMYGYHAYLVGVELPQLAREMEQYSQAMRQLKQDFALLYNELYRHAAVSWIEPGPTPEEPYCQTFYQSMLPTLHATQNRSAVWIVYLNSLIFSYVFGRIGEALATANEAEQFIDAAAGATTYPPFYFYDSLIRLAACAEAGADQRAALLAKVASNQAKLRPWAEGAPMNYLHKYRLVEAELARVGGETGAARAAYDQAIDGALEHAYINDAALAYELAGRAYLGQGQSRLARYYLRDAHYSYQRWGARVKAEALEREYPQFLARTDGGAPSATITTSGTTMSNVLDFSSVLKASQTISGEIVLGSLLSRMLMLVMENAGAQRGVLLLDGPAGLTIDAHGTAEDGITFLQSVPLAEAARGTAPLLPESVVNYVARTHESVVLNDATHESGYANDHYVALSQPKSVLCMPLLNQTRLVGILYLENNLATSAFTTDRIEVLRLLSTQIAISVENASLYRNLERSEKKYRTIFEDSRDTIFITTPGGQIVDINPAGAALLGHSRDQLLQMSAAQLYAAPEQRGRFTAAMDGQGQVKDFEVRLRRSDGQEIDCLITATARPATSSAPAVYEGIIRDITAQKAAEKERLRFSALQRELDVAHNIQSSLLPPLSPAWPALDVQCYNVPARDVGGDLYAYHAFDERHFALAVGDVSGKGMPAALLMAVSLASLQSIIQQAFAPEALLAYLDTAIIPYTRTTMQNCALVYLDIVLGPDGGTLRAANAGCVTPLIRRADGSAEWLEIGGFPLGTGLGARAGYPPSELALRRGDLVILSSDGVIEAQNAARELFGFERLAAAASAGPADSAAAMLGHIQREVDAFMAGAELHDDLTLLVVRV